MKYRILSILCILCMLVMPAGCSSEGTESSSEPPESSSQSSQEESSEEESSEQSSEEESSSEMESSESSEASSEESEEEEPVTGGNGSTTFDMNSVYSKVATEDTDDALMLLVNQPDGELLYTISVTDEFNLAANDQVLMIPKYEHSTIRVWTLKSVIDPATDTPTQERDEMIYECLDSHLKTVLYTSIPRVEDAPQYVVVVETPIGSAEYVFEYQPAGTPDMEYLEMEAVG